MLVVSRFAVPEVDGDDFRARAEAALEAFARSPGYRHGYVGRSVDDPTRWVVATVWDGVGAYRRSLSSYEVRVISAPLLAESIDEPSAYEVLAGDEGPRASDLARG